MKITENESINLDNVTSLFLSDTKNKLTIGFNDSEGYTTVDDDNEGEGFCKNLKAKIDAYFEAKESLVMHQASVQKTECGHHYEYEI